MRCLVVYCHPCPESLTASVRDTVLGALNRGGHEVRLVDLYAEGFDPVMSTNERRGYHEPGENEKPVADQLDHLRWADGTVDSSETGLIDSLLWAFDADEADDWLF